MRWRNLKSNLSRPPSRETAAINARQQSYFIYTATHWDGKSSSTKLNGIDDGPIVNPPPEVSFPRASRGEARAQGQRGIWRRTFVKSSERFRIRPRCCYTRFARSLV